MTIDYQLAREALVRSLRGEITDGRVLDAIGNVAREHFIPEQLRRHAYEDRALPIARDQTIPQPLMGAVMTQAPQPPGAGKLVGVGPGWGRRGVLAYPDLSPLSPGAPCARRRAAPTSRAGHRR